MDAHSACSMSTSLASSIRQNLSALYLLVLAGPKAASDGPFALFLFSPHEGGGVGTNSRIACLPVPSGEKAEGLLVATRDGDNVGVVVVHDGVPDGDPTLYKIVLPNGAAADPGARAPRSTGTAVTNDPERTLR